MTEEEAIRRALALNAQLEDDHQAEAWSLLFDEDAMLAPSNAYYTGRSQIRNFVESFWRDHPDRRTKHLCGNPAISLSPTRAEATTDVVVFERFADGPWQLSDVARYHDRFTRKAGRWLIVERRILT